ncbi:MAG: hypothetical protein MUP63_00805 [Candidatus Nanohaloarchaeota archaeon QJJ-7]|nr:hypothetical protein [Candidatus Nanohaloarchaeota archaeon QJJ-7]
MGTMRVTIPRPKTFLKDLENAIRGTLHTPGKVVTGVAMSLLVYSLFVLSTFPEYSWQLLSSDIAYLGEALVALNSNLFASVGAIGTSLMIVYSVLTAVVLLHIVIQVSSGGVYFSLGGIGGMVPVFFIGGCAGCGAGLIGLLGAAGAIGILPFQGNGVRVLGSLFLIGFLGYYGDPRTCNLD